MRVTETYDRILDKIEDDYRPRISHIFQLVCFGLRPIRVEEAAMLWLVGDNTEGQVCASDDTLFNSEDILDFFGGLVSIEIVDHPHDFTRAFLNRNSRK